MTTPQDPVRVMVILKCPADMSMDVFTQKCEALMHTIIALPCAENISKYDCPLCYLRQSGTWKRWPVLRNGEPHRGGQGGRRLAPRELHVRLRQDIEDRQLAEYPMLVQIPSSRRPELRHASVSSFNIHRIDVAVGMATPAC
ncbi:hypothetical protein B0H13DRAFT_1889423 [Mycena leptocephala]|nr:hypothetical protein B0H13DRAFT_1889423 [Mycena leptocephala]